MSFAQPSAAFDWGSFLQDLVEKVYEIKEKIKDYKNRHRKPEMLVYGPVTYFVGDTGGTASFNGDPDSRYRIHLKGTDACRVEFTVNGDKYQVLLLGRGRDIKRPIELRAKNTLKVTKITGPQRGSVTISITTRDIDLPPAPETIAPALNPTQPTDIANSTAFIYSGNNPIQTGVDASTILKERVSIIRGKVKEDDGTAISGVLVEALNHPEYGQTLTRADGAYDFAVNGGEEITLKYTKAGYIGVQRKAATTWRAFMNIDDVMLVEPDSIVTRVTTGANSAAQTALSTPVSDKDGQRRAVVYFPPGTSATLKFASGGSQTVNALNIRTTEFTVGPNGPKRMPAHLPSNIGYTYAVSFDTDEAAATGADSVSFSRPVYHYVENFLKFPTGTVIPVGYYDEQIGQWIAAPNGRVIKILSIAAGVANLDVNGNNQAATAAELTALDISATERRTIASLYTAGATIWRSPISHFSTFDMNLGIDYPKSEADKLLSIPPKDNILYCPMVKKEGSIIDVQNQVLGESIAIAGTPFSLNYSGSRIVDRKSAYTMKIPITTNVVANVASEILGLGVAGTYQQILFPPAPNQVYEFVWDGKDGYGRQTTSPQIVNIGLGYNMVGRYVNPLPVPNVFGVEGGTSFPTPIAPRDFPQEHIQYTAVLGVLDARMQGLGGWMLDIHHAYDTTSQTIYYGDGSEQKASALGSSITHFAGNGSSSATGNGGPATNAGLVSTSSMAVLPDGRILIPSGNTVREISKSGVITHFAGNGGNFFGNGIPVANVSFGNVTVIGVGGNGDVYVGDRFYNVIRKISNRGIVTTAAGGGYTAPSATPINATSLNIGGVKNLAVANDGTLFLTSQNFSGLIRVGTDGRAQLVPDTASYLPANQELYSFAVTPDGGTVYATYYGRVYAINMNNSDRSMNISGLIDGEVIMGMAVKPTGELFVSTSLGRLHSVNASRAVLVPLPNDLNGPTPLLALADGSFLVGEWQNFRIQKIVGALPAYSGLVMSIPSPDGSEIFDFDANGKHLKTRDALTNATIYAFSYNASGLLQSVTDRVGNITSIQRNADGIPTAIVSPYGVTTALNVNGDGYLSAVIGPENSRYDLAYNSGTGLLRRFQNPTGAVSTYQYDSKNRLNRNENAAGGVQTISRTDTGTQSHRIQYKDQSGIESIFEIGFPISKDVSTNAQNADGSATQSQSVWGGARSIATNDGMLTTSKTTADPRFGWQSAYLSQSTISTPSGNSSSYAAIKSVTYSAPGASAPFELKTVENRSGKLWTSVYDSATRTTSQVSPLGRTTQTTLDSVGRISAVQSPGLPTVGFYYDSRGRIQAVQEGSRVTSYDYDSRGYLSRMTDPMSRSTQYVRDNIGRALSQILPDGRQIDFNYDANGNVTSIKPPGRPPALFSFNSLDLMSVFAPLLGAPQVTTYDYRSDRKLASMTRPTGDRADYIYSGSTGQLTKITSSSATREFTYTPAGQVQDIIAKNASGVAQKSTYYYDGRLPAYEVVTGEVSGAVQWIYDDEFRPTVKAAMVTIYAPGNTYSTFGTRYLFDNDGLSLGTNLMQLTRHAVTGLAVSSTMSGAGPTLAVTDTFGYNAQGELTSTSVKAFNVASNYYQATLGRDGLGRITSKSDNVLGTTSTSSYDYDISGRLVTAVKNGVETKYTYDANGNRLSKNLGGVVTTSTYNSTDQLLTSGTVSYSYTANGERAAKHDSSTGETTLYRYDVFGNLIGVTLPDGRVIEYVIDGQNRRVGKKVNGVLTNGYLYLDQYRLAAMYTNTGKFQYYTYPTHQNSPEVWYEGDGTVMTIYRSILDERGTPKAVLKYISGTVDANGVFMANAYHGTIAARLETDEFGKVLSDTNPSVNPYKFAGCQYDVDTKLCHFGARDYDPETGQWLSRDPILFNGGDTNLYGYSFSDPVNFIDPDGKFGLAIAGGIIGAITGGTGSSCGANTPGFYRDVFVGAASGSLIGVGVGAISGSFGFATGVGLETIKSIGGLGFTAGGAALDLFGSGGDCGKPFFPPPKDDSPMCPGK